MAKDKKSRLDRLDEALGEDILNASDEEILEETKNDGVDPAAYAASMRGWLSKATHAADAARLKRAREELEADRAKVVLLKPHTSAAAPFQPDTMAARHGKHMSDKDREALSEDWDELFDDNTWDEDDGEK